jgi:hypothetical protein
MLKPGMLVRYLVCEVTSHLYAKARKVIVSGHIMPGRWLGQACSRILDNINESDPQVPALSVNTVMRRLTMGYILRNALLSDFIVVRM